MPKEQTDAGSSATNGQANLTLTEVAKRTGISMPTLQKYKKRFSARIPSVGKGRSQRYPESSLQVFSQLRDENMSRRGRPRKDAGAATAAAPTKGAAPRRRGVAKGRRAAAPGKGEGEGLLTLTQIAQKTGISYPTLMRYVKTHPDRLPHVGSGRRRRFKPEAVEAFQQLRSASRKPAAAKGKPAAAKSEAKSEAKSKTKSKTRSKVKSKAKATRKPAAKATAKRGRRPAAAAAQAARPKATPAARGRGRGRARAASNGGGGEGAGLQAILERLEKRLASVEEQLKKPLRVEVRR